MKIRKCPGCGKDKPAECFPIRRQSVGGRHDACRECSGKQIGFKERGEDTLDDGTETSERFPICPYCKVVAQRGKEANREYLRCDACGHVYYAQKEVIVVMTTYRLREQVREL